MTPIERDAIRGRLHAKLAEVLRRHAKVTSSLRRERTPLGTDWEDNAAILENDEVLDALDADERVRVVQLRAAIVRLAGGEYGLCVTCGETIAAGRLEALPEVATCVACARAAES
jgi:RNA polymerase-binding transcription factor DksA